MDIIKKIQKIFITKEFRNFFIGGATAFALDFSILYFLAYILNFRAELFDLIFIPNIISTGISIVYAFFFQKHIAFKSNSQSAKRQFGKFIMVHLTNLIIFNAILFGILLNLHLSVAVSKVIATGCQMFFSFLLYKFFVFKKPNAT